MAERKPVKISFNKVAVKKMGKDKFVKEFKDVYPENDMVKEWESLNTTPATPAKDK